MREVASPLFSPRINRASRTARYSPVENGEIAFLQCPEILTACLLARGRVLVRKLRPRAP
ncbi:hypothetical protein CHELA1G11_70052 [Hyphomicrobiales bacterium]|nr:hypothetical protein CHELA1G2_60038 [Hyphomicrobiales bacterium]CAH1696946.1 hypothetical protein CHELA1G11_70052 [Hyphomicrobiales bacterium]